MVVYINMPRDGDDDYCRGYTKDDGSIGIDHHRYCTRVHCVCGRHGMIGGVPVGV